METPNLDRLYSNGTNVEAIYAISSFIDRNRDLFVAGVSKGEMMAGHFGISLEGARLERDEILKSFVRHHAKLRSLGENGLTLKAFVDGYRLSEIGRSTVPLLGEMGIPVEEVTLDEGDDAILDAIHDAR